MWIVINCYYLGSLFSRWVDSGDGMVVVGIGVG